MKRAWTVLALLALACVAGSARGQGLNGGGLLVGGPGTVLVEENVPAAVHGQIVVSFRGDSAAGCAAYGVCPYAGTVIVRPSGALLAIVTSRVASRIRRQALLVLSGFGGGLTTSARVQRSRPAGPGGTCVDAQPSSLGSNSGAAVHGRSLTIRLLAPGGALLQTRCAGPLDGDLAGAVPAVTIPIARALHGGAVLDFSGTRGFAAHGFAGTASSTVVMELGKAQPQSVGVSGASFPPGIRTARIRTVTQQLRPVRTRGELSAAISGTSDPVVCRLLDTCGLSGNLTSGVGPRGVFAQVVAMGPASRPYSDFLTALGLGGGGRARGIGVTVVVTLEGAVRASVSQDSAACNDMAPAGGLAAAVSVRSGTAGFGFVGGSAYFAAPWRTRCPGPDLAGRPDGLAASLTGSGLGRRRVTVELRATGALTDDGYLVTPHGDMTVVLRRGRIRQHVDLQPLP